MNSCDAEQTLYVRYCKCYVTEEDLPCNGYPKDTRAGLNRVDFSTPGNRNQHQVSGCLLRPPRDECQRGWIAWLKRYKLYSCTPGLLVPYPGHPIFMGHYEMTIHCQSRIPETLVFQRDSLAQMSFTGWRWRVIAEWLRWAVPRKGLSTHLEVHFVIATTDGSKQTRPQTLCQSGTLVDCP